MSAVWFALSTSATAENEKDSPAALTFISSSWWTVSASYTACIASRTASRGLTGAGPLAQAARIAVVASRVARVFFVMQSSSARWPVQSTHSAGLAEIVEAVRDRLADPGE